MVTYTIRVAWVLLAALALGIATGAIQTYLELEAIKAHQRHEQLLKDERRLKMEEFEFNLLYPLVKKEEGA